MNTTPEAKERKQDVKCVTDLLAELNREAERKATRLYHEAEQREITRIRKDYQESGVLSDKDAGRKRKQELWKTLYAAGTSTLLGAGIAGLALLFPPAAIVASGAWALPIAGAAVTAAAGMLGFGAGKLCCLLMPFTPALDEERSKELMDTSRLQAQERMVQDAIGRLRLMRSSGRIGYGELADMLEIAYDQAQLTHRLPEELAVRLRDEAKDALSKAKESDERTLIAQRLKQEAEQHQEEMTRGKSQEARDGERHRLEMKRGHHEMNLERLMNQAKVDRIRTRTHANDNLAQIARVAAAMHGRRPSSN